MIVLFLYLVMAQFKFQSLEVWQLSITLTDKLLDIADRLSVNKKYRFAEQLNGAALSISNNIAEGSGSISNKEFAHYLNIAHRSVFENANILVVLERRKYISDTELNDYLEELDKLARKLTNFRKYLLK
ncbi:four helix bundle protein [Pedobacter sp. W3I1]|nr:four helix bundle protein [Pedobacter sp. W3I1]